MERLRFDDDSAFTLADDAATIARIVRTVSADRLRAVKFGDWTAVEVIGHLADASEMFAERVRRCIDEDRPALPSFDPPSQMMYSRFGYSWLRTDWIVCSR